jgi:tetratricopeptide (TPR) repeat protein
MAVSEDLKDFIEYKLPYPLAVVYRNYRNQDEEDWQERTRLLVALFEITVKILASITIKSYLLDGGKDSNLNERLKSFTRPALGHWLEVLREGLKYFKDRPRTPLVNHLYEFLFGRLKCSEEIQQKAGRLARSLETAPPKADRLAYFDLLVTLRNKMAHGARLSPEEYRERFECVRPIVEAQLNDLRFMADYPIVYVSEVKVSSGLFDHIVQNCNGKDFERQRFRAEEPLDDHQLYICQFEDLKSAPVFALSLSPFMVFEYCTDCKREQIFFLNELRGKKIEFLSYQCGHLLTPPEHISDLQDIFDFLSGKVSVEDLFRGRVLGRKVPRTLVSPTQDEKAICARLVALGETCLLEERVEEAIAYLRKAVALDPDAEAAHFLLATALLYQGEAIDEAIHEYKEVTRLNPQNALAQLALGKIFIELGDSTAARARLALALEADPANQEARELLQTLGLSPVTGTFISVDPEETGSEKE